MEGGARKSQMPEPDAHWVSGVEKFSEDARDGGFTLCGVYTTRRAAVLGALSLEALWNLDHYEEAALDDGREYPDRPALEYLKIIHELTNIDCNEVAGMDKKGAKVYETSKEFEVWKDRLTKARWDAFDYMHFSFCVYRVDTIMGEDEAQNELSSSLSRWEKQYAAFEAKHEVQSSSSAKKVHQGT